MPDIKNKKTNPIITDIIFLSVTAVALGVIVLLSMLLAESGIMPFALAFILLTVFAACAVLLISDRYRKRAAGSDVDVIRAEHNSFFEMARKLNAPAIICDKTGAILWFNDAFTAAADSSSRNCPTVHELFPGAVSLLEGDGEKEGDFMLGSRTYKCTAYELHSQEKSFVLLILTDISELVSLRDVYKKEQPVVVYIRIDNLEEMQQYLKDEYRSVEARTNTVIKQWAQSLSAVLREYDRNRYFMMITSEALDRCIKNKFSVLDEIRDIRVSETGSSITASIGAARMSGTLAERGAAAVEAQKLALERGGDQAVVRTDDSGILYFGGVTQTAQKVTKIRSRVFANDLCTKISSSDNVLICGHRHIDFDAIGAAVGMARLAFFCGVRVNIIVDREDTNVKLCTERLKALPEYADVFINEDEALELVSSESLMIFVDVNNPKLFEAPRVAEAVANKVFVDHHRKVLDFDYSSAATYIEVSASSASELVAEMIEQTLPPRTLQKQEAELLLAGIQLDTKRFTKATGPRTFSAALFLRGAGANPEETRSLFDTELSAMKDEAAFETSAVIYAKHPNIAIAASENAGIITAARVADKLLELRGVDASFAIVPTETAIHISGRSNGKVNVQHILEKLGGGGRFEEAGAQLKSDSLDTAAKDLRGAIDEYFAELSKK